MGSPNWTRRGGAAPLSLSLSLSFPFPLRWKEGGSQLGLGVLVGLPPLGSRPRPVSSPPLLYIRGQWAPQSTSILS